MSTSAHDVTTTQYQGRLLKRFSWSVSGCELETASSKVVALPSLADETGALAAETKIGGAVSLITGTEPVSIATGAPAMFATGAMNRYPLLASVSMSCGLSTSSLSAWRSLRIELFRPTSKSTNVSAGHSFCFSSCRETTFPAFATSSTSTRNGCSCSLIRTPLLRSSPSCSESSNRPKRKVRSRSNVGSVGTIVHCCKCAYHSAIFAHDQIDLPKRVLRPGFSDHTTRTHFPHFFKIPVASCF